MNSLQSTQRLYEFTRQFTKDDLVFCVISGGGSAILSAPREGVTLEEIQALTRKLLACGASIGEMNSIRKHLDSVKGGGLARWVDPATMITLILSDVVGSPLDVIASGPTVADPSTFGDAWAVLEKYKLLASAPENIIAYLKNGKKLT